MMARQAYRAGGCATDSWRLAFVRGTTVVPREPQRGLLLKGLVASLPFVLALTFLIVAPASSRILKTFLCDPFTYDDATRESSVSYLHDDYSLVSGRASKAVLSMHS